MVRKIASALAVLALTAVPAAAGGTQAAQAAQSPHSARPAATGTLIAPNPSVAVWGSNQYVFWKGRGAGLWEAAFNGSWHGPVSLHMGVLLSTPSAAVTTAGRGPYVTWEGTNGHLYLAYFNGSWHGPYGIGGGSIGSAPDIAAAGDGRLYIFWRTTNGSLEYINSSTSPGATGWSAPKPAHDGSLGSGPSVTMNGGGVSAVWAGAGNTLVYRAQDNSLHNLGYHLGSPASLVGLPSDYRTGFFVGTNGYLYAGQWRYLTLTHTLSNSGAGQIHQGKGGGIGGFGSAPTAAFSQGTYYVYWQGLDKNLWEATENTASNAGWIVHNLGMGPL